MHNKITLPIVFASFVFLFSSSGFAQEKEVSLEPTQKSNQSSDSSIKQNTQINEKQSDAKLSSQDSKNKSSYNELTDEEKKIFDRGEIGQPAYIIGGILGTYPLGFGIGHAIQGRFTDKGWIFLVSELGSALLVTSGIVECASNALYWRSGGCPDSARTKMTIGVFAFVGFRIWEIVDLWAGPPAHNRRYQQIKSRRQGLGSQSKPLLIVSQSFDTPTLGLRLEY